MFIQVSLDRDDWFSYPNFRWARKVIKEAKRNRWHFEVRRVRGRYRDQPPTTPYC